MSEDRCERTDVRRQKNGAWNAVQREYAGKLGGYEAGKTRGREGERVRRAEGEKAQL
jgi:hypothetical protein